MNDFHYQTWRNAKLAGYPRGVEDLFVEIGGLGRLSETERAAILARFRRCNMAIYKCLDQAADRASVRQFAARFGLRRLDFHLCANDDGVSELSVAGDGVRTAYVPYSNRSLSWHTDGYYNDLSRPVRAVVLHCAETAATGGENALLDPEIAYIRLRDENPAFITALEHPECMTIPANTGEDGTDEIRPEVCGPVFSGDPRSGALHMRYSARKKNIRWRDDPLTRAALGFLSELLAAADGPVLRYRLRAGEGLISNNVLHNRTAFEDGPGQRRLLYRARYYDRIESGS
jgi:alpha-ketoglutarate-dependent taurine dioxygenase